MNSFWSASWRNLSIATFTAIFSSSLVPFSRRKKPSEAEPPFIFAPPPGLPSAIFYTGRARGQPRLRLRSIYSYRDPRTNYNVFKTQTFLNKKRVSRRELLPFLTFVQDIFASFAYGLACVPDHLKQATAAMHVLLFIFFDTRYDSFQK